MCIEKKKDETCFNALFKYEKMALMRCDTNYYYEALGEKKNYESCLNAFFRI